ncbi:MAG: hypothetical protein WCB85_12155 [Candidatus Dormiibacterota bacterium]
MRYIERFLIAAVGLGLAGAGTLGLTSSQALADAAHSSAALHAQGHHDRLLLEAPLAPSVPSDPSLFGVAAAGAPWRLEHGNVELARDGTLRIDVDRLVLTSTGANPLPDLAATVFCSGTSAAVTTPVAYSTAGNAQIHARVTLPALCVAPAVLLNPATGTASSDVRSTAYIGFDGTA